MISLLFRIQKSVTSSNSCTENTGTKHEPWWLPAICNDMCELSQAAGLLIAGSYAREAWPCCQGRSTFLPPILVVLLHPTLLSYSNPSSVSCKFNTLVYNFCGTITKPFILKSLIPTVAFVQSPQKKVPHISMHIKGAFLCTTNYFPISWNLINILCMQEYWKHPTCVPDVWALICAYLHSVKLVPCVYRNWTLGEGTIHSELMLQQQNSDVTERIRIFKHWLKLLVPSAL